jgi:RNA recognition motif-containing protein
MDDLYGDLLLPDEKDAKSTEIKAPNTQEKQETADDIPSTAGNLSQPTTDAAPSSAHKVSPAPPASKTKPTPQYAREEWMLMADIPEEWLPLPAISVSNIPLNAREVDVEDTLLSQGLLLHSFHIDPSRATDSSNSQFGLARLLPPPAPTPDEPTPTDAATLLAQTVESLSKQDASPLTVFDNKLSIAPCSPSDVVVFVGNLTPEHDNDKGLKEFCSQYGTLLRCFVVKNHKGESKHYGLVEFALPSDAEEFRKQHLTLTNQLQQQQQQAQEQSSTTTTTMAMTTIAPTEAVGPRQRKEIAEPSQITAFRSQFSKTIYFDSLNKNISDPALIKSMCSKYGYVEHVLLPKAPPHPQYPLQSKGYAFVQFERSIDADRAQRSLDGEFKEGFGKLSVSFANPAKCFDQPQQQRQQQQQQQQSYYGAQQQIPPPQQQQEMWMPPNQQYGGGGAAGSVYMRPPPMFQQQQGYQVQTAASHYHHHHQQQPPVAMNKVYVGGIIGMDLEIVKAHFSQFGEVTGATGGPKGFGFITFSDPASAQICLATPHQQIGDRNVIIRKAFDKERQMQQQQQMQQQVLPPPFYPSPSQQQQQQQPYGGGGMMLPPPIVPVAAAPSGGLGGPASMSNLPSPLVVKTSDRTQPPQPHHHHYPPPSPPLPSASSGG